MSSFIETSETKTTAIDQGFSPDADLAKFLERKVQIATKTWNVGTPFTDSIFCWTNYLSNPAVKDKLANYAMIKGDLMLTILVNGTPFHAGMLLASYAYMNEVNEVITIGGDTQLITRSQRPHIYLNASTCKGGCICAPFFWPYNYFNLINGVHSPNDIGKLHIYSMSNLLQVNGGTDKVSVTVFAQMVNVKLTAPTCAPVGFAGRADIDFDAYFTSIAQSDEYPDKGVVSGPASAVAAYAGILSQIPIIAPFALATQIGANAVGSIARLFGYSKPTVISDLMPMRSYPISSLSVTEGGDTCQKMTVTAKQELSIDPALCGLPRDDLLSIASMTKRESYVDQFSWDPLDPSAGVGNTIYSCLVNPMHDRRSTLLGGRRIIPTSLSFATRAFTAWSGTLKYRFQIVGSQYHRGRLAIIYDPVGPLTGDPFNTTFNVIIDLAEGRDFTVEFPWMQDNAYANVDASDLTVFSQVVVPETLSTNNGSNGVFYVVVVNELVVPDSVTPLKILVSIAAGDDYEVMNPSGALDQFSYFPIAQSGDSSVDFDLFFSTESQSASATEVVPEEENAPEGVTNITTIAPSVVQLLDEKPLIYYGERILSFRQLLKRYCFSRSMYHVTTQARVISATFDMRMIPYDPGFDPAGPDTTAALNPYTYAGTPYFSYLKRAFAGWRGSIRWKVLPQTENKLTQIVRLTGTYQQQIAASAAFFSYNLNLGASTPSQLARANLVYKRSTSSGTALTLNRTQDGLEYEIPMAVPFRFCTTKLYPWTSNAYSTFSPGGDTLRMVVTTSPEHSNIAVDTYCAAGEDLVLLGWIGAPVVYWFAAPPGA
jgi:hypothetical protein